jgi:hypothetical protein
MSRCNLAIATLAAALLLKSQISTGEIDIVVQDITAAVIRKAAITITGSHTGNLVRAISTNEAGLAEAPLLPPGSTTSPS